MKTFGKLSKRVLKSHISISSGGEHTKVKYFAPTHHNDRKRIGTELLISVGKASVVLDGRGRRSLEKVLKRVSKMEKQYC